MKVLIALGVGAVILWTILVIADAVGDFCDDMMWRD